MCHGVISVRAVPGVKCSCFCWFSFAPSSINFYTEKIAKKVNLQTFQTMVAPIFHSPTKKLNTNLDLILQQFPSPAQKIQVSEQGLHPASDELYLLEKAFVYEWEMQRNEVEQRTIDFCYTVSCTTVRGVRWRKRAPSHNVVKKDLAECQIQI